jgi:hypothetical protein
LRYSSRFRHLQHSSSFGVYVTVRPSASGKFIGSRCPQTSSRFDTYQPGRESAAAKFVWFRQLQDSRCQSTSTRLGFAWLPRLTRISLPFSTHDACVDFHFTAGVRRTRGISPQVPLAAPTEALVLHLECDGLECFLLNSTREAKVDFDFAPRVLRNRKISSEFYTRRERSPRFGARVRRTRGISTCGADRSPGSRNRVRRTLRVDFHLCFGFDLAREIAGCIYTVDFVRI